MKLSLKSVARLTRRMATYQDSFVDIRRALESLASSARDHRTSASLKRVSARIDDGDSLYEAFSKEGNLYPQIFLRMTKVGEESGTLAEVYAHLAQYLEEQVAMRSRFLWRLVYPAFMLVGAVVVHSVITAFYASLTGSGVDWSRLEVIFLKTFLMDIAKIGAVVGIILAARLLFWGRSITDAFLIFVPPFCWPFKKTMLARFAFSMGLMTGSAIPLAEAVRESGEATGNGYAAWVLEKASARIEEGMQLTPALVRTRLFPEDFINVVEIAEESGKVSESLQRVAVHYREDADISMNRLVSGIAWAIYLGIVVLLAYYIVSLYARYVQQIYNSMM
ncbi:MAG: type II secretion system F family protein [Planctomycetes bacterium]|nr:type II secretion system F family protein [Planctomycetota bacterium]